MSDLGRISSVAWSVDEALHKVLVSLDAALEHAQVQERRASDRYRVSRRHLSGLADAIGKQHADLNDASQRAAETLARSRHENEQWSAQLGELERTGDVVRKAQDAWTRTQTSASQMYVEAFATLCEMRRISAETGPKRVKEAWPTRADIDHAAESANAAELRHLRARDALSLLATAEEAVADGRAFLTRQVDQTRLAVDLATQATASLAGSEQSIASAWLSFARLQRSFIESSPSESASADSLVHADEFIQQARVRSVQLRRSLVSAADAASSVGRSLADWSPR